MVSEASPGTDMSCHCSPTVGCFVPWGFSKEPGHLASIGPVNTSSWTSRSGPQGDLLGSPGVKVDAHVRP